jgi:2,4-dienoyl-CoA reductase-like NADH-dependent reductase (Old Yellow Enzyme family)
VYDNLFEPIQISGLEIPNRIVRTAHGTFLKFPGPGEKTASLVRYHEARARGGVGMSILEVAPVHQSSLHGWMPAWKDEAIEGYRVLADAVRPYGMKLFQQLWHGGHVGYNALGGPPWSASDVPNPTMGAVPIPMTKTMIDEIVAAFAAAARRCKEGGLDGVEVHGAHGYLPAQFFSQATNHRTDEYGGPIENRVRFCREVLEAIRADVGPDFPISLRIVADEEYEGGIVPAEAVQIAQLLEPYYDILNVSIGNYWSMYKILAPMEEPTGYELPTTSIVTQAVSKPTIVTGRITSLELASQIVADGIGDMVSMVRALIADPHLVRKSRDGRVAEVRPCIGTNQACPGPPTGHVECVVNPAAGYEGQFETDEFEKVAEPRRILVAGGGPAGLEAARTAALRGHEVLLCEMTGQLGGQVTIAGSAPRRSELNAIVGFLTDEMSRVGVTVKLRTFAEPDLIDGFGPDALIVATGSTPRRDGFQVARPAQRLKGAGLPHVYTCWDVFGFGGRATIGEAAVVYDDTGTYEAISVADAFLERGAAVTLVSRFDTMGARVAFGGSNHSTTTTPAKERLLSNPRFAFVGSSYLSEITRDDVEVRLALNVNSVPARYAADTVVMTGFNESNRDLADYYQGTRLSVHVVGDANGTREMQAAFAGGAAAGRAV